MKNRIKQLYKLLLSGEYSSIAKGITKRIKSEQISYGLKKDLTDILRFPPCFVKISIRKATESDHSQFVMDYTNQGLKDAIPTAYVAENDKGQVCFRQWLIGPTENKQINRFWGGSYPILKKDEVLIESAFTLPKYRGLGIMPRAMMEIAQMGSELGAKYALTFTPIDNLNSLKASHFAGFKPYILRRENWFLGIKKVKFEELDQKSLEFYHKVTGRI